MAVIGATLFVYNESSESKKINACETAVTALWWEFPRASSRKLDLRRAGSNGIPGAKRMQERYLQLRLDLPAVARAANLDPQELNFLDYRMLVTGWLDENSW